MKLGPAVLTAFLMVAACDGRNEDAGERIDAQTGATGGESSIVSGPAEKRGEELDRRAAEQRRAQSNAQ
jgi:hypothetical protein